MRGAVWNNEKNLTCADCAESQTVNGTVLTAAIKGYSYIYAPAGQAEEYAPLAANPYRGCEHKCAYCYVPGVLRITRPEFDAGAFPREDYIHHLVRDARKYQQAGITEQVMLSFTTDPYHPGDTTLTRQTIEVLQDHGLGVCTLTKGGTRALRDLALFRPDRDALASTLTSMDDGFSRKRERGAPLPGDRIAALRAFHDASIFVWLSLEPTLDVENSLRIIEVTHPFVDLYKIGRANYLPITKTTDWRDYTERVINLCANSASDITSRKTYNRFCPPNITTLCGCLNIIPHQVRSSQAPASRPTLWWPVTFRRALWLAEL